MLLITLCVRCRARGLASSSLMSFGVRLYSQLGETPGARCAAFGHARENDCRIPKRRRSVSHERARARHAAEPSGRGSGRGR
jgi:hypothetical protein